MPTPAVPCFHCGEPIPEGIDCPVILDGKSRPTCCTSCQQVAELIIDSGMSSFYQFRTKVSAKPDIDLQSPEALHWNDFLGAEPDQTGLTTISLYLEGIECAACGWLIEQRLLQQNGITKANLSLATHVVTVTFSSALIQPSAVVQTIEKLGFTVHANTPDQQANADQAAHKMLLLRMAVAGIASMQVMMYAGVQYHDLDPGFRQTMRYLSLLVCLPVLLFSALPFFTGMIRSLKAKSLTMDVPVGLAIGSAYIASAYATFTGSGEVYFESVAMFSFFLLLARYLEHRARSKWRLYHSSLRGLIPEFANVIDQYGALTKVPRHQVTKDQLLVVKPGELIPCDGVVTEGRSSLDASLLSGEFDPLIVGPESSVIAGSKNLEHPLTIRVTEPELNKLRISQILQHLEGHESQPSRTSKTLQRIVAGFIAGVLILTLISYIGWSFISPDQAFWVALSVLVVTCPCALSLSIPTAQAAAHARAAQLGVHVLSEQFFTRMAQVTRVIFDKTGTLTEGKPSLSHTWSLLPEQDILPVIAKIERLTHHPIRHAFDAIPVPSDLSVREVSVKTGKGIEAFWEDRFVQIGTPEWLGVSLPDHFVALSPKASQVAVLLDHQLVAGFLVQDAIRPNAPTVVRILHKAKLNVGLLSGDRQNSVKEVQTALNLDFAEAACSPEDKATYLANTQHKGSAVMVGDGINDVPIMKEADLSIAMGSGALITQANADAVLISNKLERIPALINLSRRTTRTFYQNMTWAIGYNLTAVPLAMMGFIPPWGAALGMTLSSLLVTANSLKLMK